MSANDGAMMARNPYCASAHTACSREDPQPKFGPVNRIVAPCAAGRLSSKSGLARQSKKRLAANPVRSTPFRNCFGTIWSVSTLARGNAATLPALKVAVRRRGAALAGAQHVGVHAEAHRATRVTPLESRFAKHAIQS